MKTVTPLLAGTPVVATVATRAPASARSITIGPDGPAARCAPATAIATTMTASSAPVTAIAATAAATITERRGKVRGPGDRPPFP